MIGVSSDDIDTLGKFSVQACQGKFPVASDNTQSVMKSYDAVMALRPDYANRVSYVIAPNGKVIYNYQSLNPSRHVEKTLAALKDWSQSKEVARGARSRARAAPASAAGGGDAPDDVADVVGDQQRAASCRSRRRPAGPWRRRRR